jgi:hypothetical protein
MLRRAALVVRLSARKHDPGKAPHEELRAVTESLIDGVQRYVELEEELASKIGQEIGGEG